ERVVEGDGPTLPPGPARAPGRRAPDRSRRDPGVYATSRMDQQLEEPDLRSHLGVIARRRWLVIAVTLLFVGVAVAMSVIPQPKYRVTAQVLTTGVDDPVALVFGGDASGNLDRAAASQLAF